MKITSTILIRIQCTSVLPREVHKENLGMLESMDAIINLMSDATAAEGTNKTLSTNNNKTGNETPAAADTEEGSNKISCTNIQHQPTKI